MPLGRAIQPGGEKFKAVQQGRCRLHDEKEASKTSANHVDGNVCSVGTSAVLTDYFSQETGVCLWFRLSMLELRC